jgi:hypothetical protein
MIEAKMVRPGLFGLANSNRDFSDPESWGKNKFNSSFPASLCCFLASKELSANYLQFSDGKFEILDIDISEVFGTNPLDKSTFFSFESPFSSFDQYAVGHNPRTDLVVSITGSEPKQTAALEVKLTAIPDQTTHNRSDDEFGAELVVRPDTIFYLAAGLAHSNPALLSRHFADQPIHLADWTDPEEALGKFGLIHKALEGFLQDPALEQHPNIIQPVWKTIGKSPILAENCLDVFVWSTSGFLYFILSIAGTDSQDRISRPMRTVIWIYSMLLDIALDGKTNFQSTIDRLSYNTKNDKAFAVSGSLTRNFMKHPNLTFPRIKKSDVRNIILGGGQNLLSPERRFDAIVVNSPELFE